MSIKQFTLPERRELIEQLRSSGTQLYEHQLTFQDQLQTFVVFNVDIGFPCYRLSNGRTKAAQKEVIVKNGLDEDFFKTDPDSESALTEQDKILREMAGEAGLFRTFKRVKQDQPLILDNEGYIVNGNRRVCAMRMLLEQDPETYAHFNHVQVLFLPPCTEKDIKELEARLQVQPEIRADYSWVSEAILYQELLAEEDIWNEKLIMDVYNKSRAELRLLITMLEDAEEYLESRGRSGYYSEVLKREYAFRQLAKYTNKCGDDAAKVHLLTNLAYSMLDDPDTAEGRLYESVPDAYKYMEEIAAAIRNEFDLKDSDGEEIKDDLDILGDEDTEEDQFTDVLDLFEDDDSLGTVRDIIRDTIEEQRNEDRIRKDESYCAKQVQAAYTKLQSALSAFNEDADITGIDNTVESIENVLDEIKKWVNNVADQD